MLGLLAARISGRRPAPRFFHAASAQAQQPITPMEIRMTTHTHKTRTHAAPHAESGTHAKSHAAHAMHKSHAASGKDAQAGLKSRHPAQDAPRAMAAAPADMAMRLMPQPWRDILSTPFSAWPFRMDQRQMLPFYSMRREMMHMADQLACSLFQAQDAAQCMLKGENVTTHADVTQDEYRFTISLPGMSADNTDVSVEPGSLIITAQREEREEKKSDRRDMAGGRMQQMFSRQHVERIFPLPWDADIGKAEAEFADETLLVTVPRIASVKAEPKTVNVRSRRHLSHNDNPAPGDTATAQPERKAS
jgi:HSP20 family molecular chaperone IbpA